jgi:alcohol dehydrogenase class IV
VVIGFGGGSAMDAAKAIVWFSQQSGINIETCVATQPPAAPARSDQRLRD